MSREPLAGVRVLVTRSRAQASTLREQLAALGAVVREVPVLSYVACELDEPPTLDELRDACVVFTSVNGVHFATRLLGGQLGGLRCATVGEATATAVREAGGVVSIVAVRSDAEGLLAAILAEAPTAPIVWFRGDDARDVLAAGLRAAGHDVRELVVYRAAPDDTSRAALARAVADGIDILTFASSNTAAAFDRLLAAEVADDVRRLPAVSIGTHTSARLALLGYAHIVEAGEATVAGLVAAVVEHVRTSKRASPPPNHGL